MPHWVKVLTSLEIKVYSNFHSERQEPDLESCPLIPINMPWYVHTSTVSYPHPCTCTHKHTNSELFLEPVSLFMLFMRYKTVISSP